MFVFMFACVLYIIVCMYTYIHTCMYIYIYAFVLQFVVVAAILNVMLLNVSSTTATLDCTLPCFSPNIWCRLFNITPNNIEVITNGGIMGSSMSYSYPTQQIIISNLRYNTTYEYCIVAVVATNSNPTNITTNNMMIRDPVCGNFATTAGTDIYVVTDSLLLFSYMSKVHNIRNARVTNSQYTLYKHITIM